MLPRAVHTRLVVVGLAVVALAALVGVYAFRQASSEADAIGRTAGLVAVGLDDQALVVALQHERWQALRDGDVDGAQSSTDALVAVRDFDDATIDGLQAARSPESPGGYEAVIDRLLDRSGHIDPGLLDGTAAAQAAVNVDLLHWRQALVEELELAMQGAGQADLDAARGVTNEWSTTLRLSAAPSQAEMLETATGADTLTALREAVDGAGAGERGLAATQAWNQAHSATATIVAAADAEIWGELVSERDGARRDARMAPLIVAAAALVALLGLFWVGRRWPAAPPLDPDEIPLDALVSVSTVTEAETTAGVIADVDTDVADDEVFVDDPASVDAPATGPVSVLEAIFDGQDSPEPIEHDDGELFEERRIAPGGMHMADIVGQASADSLRPDDVLVDDVEHGRVGAAVATSLLEALTTLIDTALAHGRRGVGVTLIGSGHDLGYLVWVVDESAGIDHERREELNAALGGQVNDDSPALLHRLATAGDHVGPHGIDIELLAGDDEMTLTRLFVPKRHLLAPESAVEPVGAAVDDEPGRQIPLPDPLTGMATERLSARLARGVRAPAPNPQPAPVAAATERPTTVGPVAEPTVAAAASRWPTTDLGPVALGDPDADQVMGDDERRAAAARRLVEQYRGGVSAALMDGSDDVVSPPSGRRS
ncbi:MAG: hypothetical protein OES57_09270 [Acidimicrobiia bacterium]|nr:hypothetical protein [Acidimicrobiia bacterium]